MGKKRIKPSSSSSVEEDDMTASNYQSLKSSIDALNHVMTEGFAKIHSDVDNLRLEFKAELAGIKSTINDLETSLNSTQQDVKDLEENAKKMTEDHTETSEALKSKIAELESQLKEAVEHNTRLEQYTRRENLRFNMITESEEEDCKTLVLDIIHKELAIDVPGIRFHAVHRVGKQTEGRPRPIIARFVCREDRDLVWSRRGKLKHSTVFENAYITEDYARAIQEERKVLIIIMDFI